MDDYSAISTSDVSSYHSVDEDLVFFVGYIKAGATESIEGAIRSFRKATLAQSFPKESKPEVEIGGVKYNTQTVSQAFSEMMSCRYQRMAVGLGKKEMENVIYRLGLKSYMPGWFEQFFNIDSEIFCYLLCDDDDEGVLEMLFVGERGYLYIYDWE